MGISNNVNKHAEELFRRFPELRAVSGPLFDVYSTLENVFVNGGRLFICGNGGSGSDSEHIVGELMKNFILRRPHSDEMKKCFADSGVSDMLEILQPGLPAISLLSHPALSSAFSNDVDGLYNYAQQLYVLGRKGDAVIGISTSGNSKNVFNCFRAATAMGIHTILFTGENNGICEKLSEIKLKAPSRETYRIQEYHLPLYHTLCIMLEERFYGLEK
ncbi:MAG: SIS domain-containing protein [Lentisphaeria bacterium]|nr:SIS domain-containing protein [Lentisphaeria bacterium]